MLSLKAVSNCDVLLLRSNILPIKPLLFHRTLVPLNFIPLHSLFLTAFIRQFRRRHSIFRPFLCCLFPTTFLVLQRLSSSSLSLLIRLFIFTRHDNVIIFLFLLLTVVFLGQLFDFLLGFQGIGASDFLNSLMGFFIELNQTDTILSAL